MTQKSRKNKPKQTLSGMDRPMSPTADRKMWMDFFKACRSEDKPEDSTDLWAAFESDMRTRPPLPEKLVRVVDAEVNARFQQTLNATDDQKFKEDVIKYREAATRFAVCKITGAPHGIPAIFLCNLSALDPSLEAQKAYLRDVVTMDPGKSRSAQQAAAFLAHCIREGRMPGGVLEMMGPKMEKLVDAAFEAQFEAEAKREMAQNKGSPPPKPS